MKKAIPSLTILSAVLILGLIFFQQKPKELLTSITHKFYQTPNNIEKSPENLNILNTVLYKSHEQCISIWSKSIPEIKSYVFQKYPELNIPNTTNTIDGYFASVKKKVAQHHGLRKDRRFKVISELLNKS